jgi:hypothetical protein
MTRSSQGLAVFEPSLAIADLFTHNFHVHMPIILLVRKASPGISRQDLEFMKEMQSKRGEEEMVILLLASGAFDVFARDKRGLPVQMTFFHSTCSNSPLRRRRHNCVSRIWYATA